MKKKFAMFLCLLCLITTLFLTLTGCKAKEAKTTNGSSSSELSAPGVFPLVKNKVTLKFFAPQNVNIKDMNTNTFTTFYENKTNVHIQWELVPADALTDKRSLALASNDLPDVFFGAGVTKEEEMLYGTQGIFLPLNKYIDKQGVEIKKMFAAVPVVKPGITTPNGSIYSLPQENQCYHCWFSQKLWINSSWLKKLNLEMPKTTDDILKVYRAFRDNDPNGNGKKDEYALSGANIKTSWHSNPVDYFMCAFIYDDGGDRLSLENGKVDVNFNKPEFKEGLKFMNTMWKEKLIDPAAFTQDESTLKQVGENPAAEILGSVTVGFFGGFTSLTGTRMKNYDAVPPLKGPNGVQTTGWYPYDYAAGQYVITKACTNPELAYKWADWLYSDEATFLYIECGREGKEWKKASATDKDLNGNPAKWMRTDTYAYGEIQNVHYYQMGPSYRSREYRESWGSPQDPYAEKGYELRLQLETKPYEAFKPATVFPPVYMDASAVKEIAQIKTPINDYVNESIAAFVTGNMDIEKEWDKYTKNLESLNLKRYIELQQKAFDNSSFAKK